ncbi:Exocyst complex subunit Exo70, C-terminal [Dillenia turbinata]|uniref:Exocyst subunit Exo70 family protein n=1 Tax=Dillenia turbinata TaxID=194707 RepID=A0AAN8ZQD6_9MAGN
MPIKGMGGLFCYAPKTASFRESSLRSSPAKAPSPRISKLERSIRVADSMIMKWNTETSTFAKVTSLFHQNRREAQDYLKCVHQLQKTMHLLVSEDSSSELLVKAHNLMQIAMKRLEKEFYQLLSSNREHLDPESVSARSTRSTTSDFDSDNSPEDGEIRIVRDSISEVKQASTVAMIDLRLIAECMIASGYSKECVKIYTIIRKSIVDEGIYRLGVDLLSFNQISKMDWEILEVKIKNWLDALKIAVKTLFKCERILCDHVFGVSDSMRESCFAEITSVAAARLFAFPEYVTKGKRSPEKIFRALDMYSAISAYWPEIESIFSYDSLSAIRSQALTSYAKLSESVRTILAEFESSVQKEPLKSLLPSGGGIHSLTLKTMEFISRLSNYWIALGEILAEDSPPAKPPLMESYFDSPNSDESSPAPAVSVKLAWLIVVLLCKLDGKAEQYQDVALSYLFLANNLQHGISVVRSCNLQYLLGEDWISKNEMKIKQFASNYEKLAWGKVMTSFMDDSTAESMTKDGAKEWFKRFNHEFEEACLKQSSCVIPDARLRDPIQTSIAKKIGPKYRVMYETHRNLLGGFVRFAPEDLENHLSDLFFGHGESRSGTTSYSRKSRERSLRGWF